MLLAEGMLLCSLFWAFCWLGTGSDEKNIRNFSTYPDEVQKIVKARPELSGNIRQRGPAAIFAGNLLLKGRQLPAVRGFFQISFRFCNTGKGILATGGAEKFSFHSLQHQQRQK
ncbi:MAG: hypothetical protein ACLU8W_09630 [Clostridia bacterium]